MAPPPLKTSSSSTSSSSSSQPLAFLNGAISTAASPLQSSFSLSCRSPLRPTHTDDGLLSPSTIRQGGKSLLQRQTTSKKTSFLLPPKQYQLPQIWNSSTAATLDRESTEGIEDDDKVTDRSFFLPQSSPGLPPQQHHDDGKIGVMSAISIIVGKTIGVGAYSVPSAVFAGVGSVGMSLVIWLLGSLISFCGLAVYLDLGTAIPKSGGERVYLERIFQRPRMLATCMFMAYVVLLGFSTPNAIVLGEYVLYALNVDIKDNNNQWNVRLIAVAAVSLLCYIHARHARLGLRLLNVLGATKILMLAVVVLCGVAGGILGVGSDAVAQELANTVPKHHVMGHHLDEDMAGMSMPMDGAASITSSAGLSTARRNFNDIWAGSSSQPYDYATALLKVIYCFRGYSTANQVLSEVKNPVRTLRVAAPLALVLISVAYMAINIAFFLVVDKEEFKSAGAVVAGLFFRNLFGDGFGAHVLPVFVIISAIGNIAATSFAQARVNEELAKDGLLPFSRFWTSRGLFLHWLVSVAVIVFPPPGKIYNFLVDIGGYPVSVISVSISLGLLYLKSTPSERWVSPWPASRFAVVVFAGSNCLLLIMPWVPPVGGRGENERFAYYAYPATALAVIVSGALYWLWWRYRGAGRSGLKDKFAPSGWNHRKSFLSSRESSSTSDDENNPAHGLLSDEDDDESQPMIDYANIRRRAPCGCPVRH